MRSDIACYLKPRRLQDGEELCVSLDESTGRLGLSQFSIVDARLTTKDVIVTADYAIERGTFSWTLHPKTGTGPDIVDTGKYLTVWERQEDGSWRITRDINNSDRAAAM